LSCCLGGSRCLGGGGGGGVDERAGVITRRSVH